MLLECKELLMRFGGLTAIDGVNLGVEKGEIKGLIGPNGSGKTTMFNMMSGLYMPTAGEIWFKGQNIARKRPHYITSCGVARTFQNIRLFGEMTVWENVLVGRHCRFRHSVFDDLFATGRKRAQERKAAEYLDGLLAMFNLHVYKDEMARNLPYGLQRELEIIRALASEPELLLLDEPAAGMNPQETTQLMKFIRRVREMGVTILVVEHDMRLVMNICDSIAVLNYGKKIAEGTPRDIQADGEVIKAYLGKRGKQGA